MNSKIVVAGATGNVGGEVLRQLAAAGHKVRAMVRDPKKASALAGPNVELVAGDFSQPASLEPALKGAERAFMATPVDEHTVEWFKAFFDAAKRAGVKHVVKLSGLGATSDSGSRIMRQHAEADAALRKSGLAFTLLQPNSFHQNLLGSAATIKSQGAFYLPMKDARQSLIDIRDIAAVAVLALTGTGHEGQAYEMTGPESLSYSDVAAQLSAALGKPVKYVDVPPDAFRQALAGVGMPAWSADAVTEIFGVFASGKYKDVIPTTAKLLGRKPIVFAQFARDFAGAFRG